MRIINVFLLCVYDFMKVIFFHINFMIEMHYYARQRFIISKISVVSEVAVIVDIVDLTHSVAILFFSLSIFLKQNSHVTLETFVFFAVVH